MRLKGYALACLSAAAYGMNPFFAVPMMRMGIDIENVLFFRFAAATLLIGVYLALARVDLRVNRRELGILMVLGLVFTISAHALFFSFRQMSSGVASTILFVYPIFVALIMGFYFKEKIAWVMWIALAIAFSGVALLNMGELGEGIQKINFLGLGSVLVSALAYALYMVIVNKSAVSGMAGPKLTFYAIGFSALFCLARILMDGATPIIPSPRLACEVLVFALITTVISCVAMVYAVQYIGSTPTAIMGALEPVVAVVVSVFWLKEGFSLRMGAGIAMIIGAVLAVILSDAVQGVFHRFGNEKS